MEDLWVIPSLLHHEGGETVFYEDTLDLVDIGPGTKYYPSGANSTCFLKFYLANYHRLGLDSLREKTRNANKKKRGDVALLCRGGKNHEVCHGRVLQYVLLTRGAFGKKRWKNTWLFGCRQTVVFGEGDLLGMSHKYALANSDFQSVLHAFCFFAVKFGLSQTNGSYFAEKLQFVRDNPDPVILTETLKKSISFDQLHRFKQETQVAVLYTLLQVRWKSDEQFRTTLRQHALYFYDDPLPELGKDGMNLYGWMLTAIRWSNGRYPTVKVMKHILGLTLLTTEGSIKDKNIRGFYLLMSIIATKRIFRLLDELIEPSSTTRHNSSSNNNQEDLVLTNALPAPAPAPAPTTDPLSNNDDGDGCPSCNSNHHPCR